jgi:hypothetical protein
MGLKIIKLLWLYILILITSLGAFLYFITIFTNLNLEINDMNANIESLDNKINKVKKENKKLINYKNNFNKYLKNGKTKKHIKSFKDFIYYQENLDDFLYLHNIDVKYTFEKKKKKILNDLYFYNLKVNIKYQNIKEITQLLNYLYNSNEIRLKEITYKNKNIDFNFEFLIEDKKNEL